MKEPLDAARELIDCLFVDRVKNGGRYDMTANRNISVPADVLVPVVKALHSFLYGKAESLDKAFGGSTSDAKGQADTNERNEFIRNVVDEFSRQYKLSPEMRFKGLAPKEYGFAETAKFLKLSESTIRSIYYGYR
jgi:hypothetical protein